MDEKELRRDTKSIGDRSELAVMSALISLGYMISIPFGENHRYDLIADRDGVLLRIQVKTGRVKNGVLEFACSSSHSHRGGPWARNYVGQIDAFGVYAPAISEVFLVPIGDLDNTLRVHMRLEPPRNGQVKRLRWAGPYRLPPI